MGMTSMSKSQIDEAVRVAVYDHFVHAGGTLDPADLAVRLEVAEREFRASYRRLAEQRALVLDADGAIAMAIPFPAIPTDVTVRGLGVTWWANSKA
jgi:hypothetical protein